MRKRKPKAKVVSGNYMDKIPHISEGHEWRELDDGNVEVDMPHKGFYAKIAQKFFHKPAYVIFFTGIIDICNINENADPLALGGFLAGNSQYGIPVCFGKGKAGRIVGRRI